MLLKAFNEMTLNEQDQALATQYAPERYPIECRYPWRVWEYMEKCVPHDNIEGFND